MMQGDAYGIAISIVQGNTVITTNNCTNVEICLQNLRKTYADAEVSFDPEKNQWIFPLTQEETFGLPDRSLTMYVRVKLNNGSVIGSAIDGVNIQGCISRQVL